MISTVNTGYMYMYCTYAQEMHRSVVAHSSAGESNDGVHVSLGGAETAADRDAEERHVVHEGAARSAQVLVHTALHNTIQSATQAYTTVHENIN